MSCKQSGVKIPRFCGNFCTADVMSSADVLTIVSCRVVINAAVVPRGFGKIKHISQSDKMYLTDCWREVFRQESSAATPTLVARGNIKVGCWGKFFLLFPLPPPPPQLIIMPQLTDISYSESNMISSNILAQILLPPAH